VWTGGGGGNQNWSNGPNWLGGVAPAYSGDSLTFAGSLGLTPNMDTNYSVPSLTFSNNAGSFNIGSANNSTLTMSDGGSIINNSANAQTLNVTIADTGGGLAKGGKGTINLPGNNTYTGQTTVNAGTLNVSGTLASTVNTVVGNSTSNSVLSISGSGSLSPFYLLVGNVSNSVGAIIQTGGTLTVNSNSGFDNLCLGNVPGSYGYYNAAGGTATINGICIGGEANNGSTGTFALAGNGIMDLNGETVTDTGWLLLARNNNNTNGTEVGVLNVYSGSLTYTGGGIVGPWDQGETGIINMMGGTVANTTAVGVYL
jgi:autotransporter-associated beta strand protein